MTRLSEIYSKINNHITSNFTAFHSTYMENVHSTRSAEQSEYTPQNTIEIVHFKEATNSNLNPRIGKSMVSLVFQHLMNNFFYIRAWNYIIFIYNKRKQEYFTYKSWYNCTQSKWIWHKILISFKGDSMLRVIMIVVWTAEHTVITYFNINYV